MAEVLYLNTKFFSMHNRTDHQRTKEQNPSLNDQALNSGSNVEKNPDDWVTGDEPMTGP